VDDDAIESTLLERAGDPNVKETVVQPIHRVDRLYVISDLHLGGAPGFQIFGSADELAWLIRHLADHDPDDEVALIINGDFIDFLAEAPAAYFDTYGAARKLERVALAEPAFRCVFEAIPYFLSKERRRLIVNLGNHDLELALPWMRARLAQILTGEALAATGAYSRLHLVFDGSGVLCAVGARSVLCLHGNEVDRWNPADFEKIRQIGRDAQLGRAVDPWIPNAGTRMVIDVMNQVKHDYPFVDLLKPEQEAIVPTLAACAPQLVGDLDRARKLAGVGLARAWAGVSKPGGMLGIPPDPDIRVPQTPIAAAASLNMAAARRQAEARTREMLRSADAQVRDGITPLALVAGVEGRQLDTFGALVKWYRKEPTSEVLREALEKLDRDRSFDIGDRDDTAVQLDVEVSPAIDIVVAGHTHLERALHRTNGSGCYFNSGTWARLIRITADVRANADQFAQVFQALKGGTMESLDALPGLVIKTCPVVAVWRDGAENAKAELRHVNTQGDSFVLASDTPTSCMESR
jgi:UDP-2,3-diacylglucosamine pyrophosphatase LpxH